MYVYVRHDCALFIARRWISQPFFVLCAWVARFGFFVAYVYVGRLGYGKGGWIYAVKCILYTVVFFILYIYS